MTTGGYRFSVELRLTNGTDQFGRAVGHVKRETLLGLGLEPDTGGFATALAVEVSDVITKALSELTDQLRAARELDPQHPTPGAN